MLDETEEIETSTGPIQIEHQIIPLPSNDNVGREYAELEISHWISHADHHLNRIRDLIAEKVSRILILFVLHHVRWSIPA